MYQLNYIKFDPEDLDIYLKIVSSDSVMKYITGKARSLNDNIKRFESILEANRIHEKGGYFKVYDRGNIIGLSKLENYPKEEHTIEVGYILMEDYWGLGYGKTICKDLIQFARMNEMASYVIGIIDPDNIASKRILTGNGLERYFVGIENDLPTEKLRMKL